ncbi:MAG: NADH-quinone oxidoreductase subunit C [SAR202 cluster bacterium]|nr:NADH-quinone oxidoreductase subunit C [SAR202 cluster bacterium]|tara:strand:- start:33734 stop:34213 length:480 start_codon:yes stop_codon:yes gene_type:complete
MNIDTENSKTEQLVKTISSHLNQFSPTISNNKDEVVIISDKKNFLNICKYLKTNKELSFDYLRCVSVVDYIDHLEINYHLFSINYRFKAVLKIQINASIPAVPSVTNIWPAANWHEREGHDLFGVLFINHPNLSTLLLPENFEGFPGRKDFPFNDYNEW